MKSARRIPYDHSRDAFAIRWLLTGLFALLLVSCGSTVPPSDAATAANTQPPQDTTLGPGDVFDVRVFGEEDLSATYRVASNGSIDFPLIGTVVVLGMTPSNVKQLLESKLIEGEFLKKPQVSILVKEYSSKKISVFGQVNKPGSFPFQDGMGVVEAISLAGGFTSMARTDETIVTRTVDGQKQKYRIPVEDIGKGRVPDFVLRPGDIIFVPERVF